MQARSRTFAAAGICLVLAACGGSPEGTAGGPDYATVAGAGRTLSFGDGLQRADYPNACSLLPIASAQALIGAPVTRDRNSVGCSWSAGDASLPSLGIAFVEIGGDAGSVYAAGVPGAKASRTLGGIGAEARIYRLAITQTVQVDVVKRNVFFRVQVRTVSTAPQDVDTADAIATRTARIVAGQIA